MPEAAVKPLPNFSATDLINLISEAPEALLITDSNQRICCCNKRLSRLFGYGENELVGQPLTVIVRASNANSSKNEEALFSEQDEERESDGLRVDGTAFPISVTSSTVPISSGSVRMHVIRDITEQRQALTVLEYIGDELRARNKDLEQFTYLASHDLKEPLRSISSFVDLLHETLSGSPDETTVTALTFIGEGVERMTQLVHDLLEYSREGGSGDFHDVDLNQTLAEVQANLKARLDSAGAKLTIHTLPTVKGRDGDLRQLLQNLISNACKFQPPGQEPHIAISAKKSEDGWDPVWEISVADNGIGIAPDAAEKIFHPFHRLHDRDSYEGTGIGLAHCQKIVERHSGRIWVDPNPTGGSVFRFTIPAGPE